MKSRLPVAICCLLTTLLVGIWLGQMMPLNRDVDEEIVERSTVSPFNSDGWQLAMGQQTGPTATLTSDLPSMREPITDPAVQPATGKLSDATELSAESDITYFPEAIVGAAAETSSGTSISSVEDSDNDSPLAAQDADAVWKAELSDLPPEQANEILKLREQLGSVASESFGFPTISETPGEPPGLFPLSAGEEARPIPIAEVSSPDELVTHASAVKESPLARSLREEAERNYTENIANIRTPGYKRRQILLLNVSVENSEEASIQSRPAVHHAGAEDSEATPDAAPPSEIEARPWLNRLDLRQGKLISTSNSLDLAIDGPGWLCVERNGKPEYVRAGVLGFDENRQLGIRTGGGLLPIQPAIHFPENGRRIVISESGEVSSVNFKEERQAIGHLASYEFLNAAALRRTNAGTYVETKAVGGAIVSSSSVRFLQSFLEAPNIDQQQELVELDHLRGAAEQITRSKRRSATSP